MTIGLMGNAEQVSITNIVFDGTTNSIQVMVQNSAGATSTVTNAFIQGTTVSTVNPVAPVTVLKSSTVTMNMTVPAGVTLTPGTSYTIKLITGKGISVVNTATYSP